MATKLQRLRKQFSVSNLIKESGTGANFGKIMAPTSKSDITPYNRERSYAGTEEFDQHFNIPNKVVYSENEVKGAKLIAQEAKEAAKNRQEVVKSQSEIEAAKTQWYKAEQELIQEQSKESLKRFEEKIGTQKMLDSQAPRYMSIVGDFARENSGAVAVMAQLDRIEMGMKL